MKTSNRERAIVEIETGQYNRLLKQGFEALDHARTDVAHQCARRALSINNQHAGGHFLVALVAFNQKNYTVARQALMSTVSLDPLHAAGWSQLARVCILTGQYNNAADALEKALAQNPKDPIVQDIIGTVFSLLGDQESALTWHNKAVLKAADNARYHLNKAACLIFLGHNDDAKTSLNRTLALQPDHAQAHWMLARLDKAQDRKHLSEISEMLKQPSASKDAEAFLWYAAGKLAEDLGDWDMAAKAYTKGAKARRQTVRYDEGAEERLFKALKETYTDDWMKKTACGVDNPSPIFIVGQPRTGTTLVERIITSHTDVHSAGELQQFAMAIKRQTGIPSHGLPMTAEIARAAAALDMTKLGQAYLDTTRLLRGTSPHFVDKLPVNYLYLPLIAAALPKAKIIHIRRCAMDSCFASYKQLFADAYVHSYDQGEMARHHVRYRNLMEHWHDLLGDRILDVHYENVVTDTEAEARRITKHLNLSWDDRLLNFHLQDQAVTTASASQVREKAHTRSVGRWRNFSGTLTKMQGILSAAGYEPNEKR